MTKQKITKKGGVVKKSRGPLDKREKGKIAEFHVISQLIASKLDVYTPILDIGVDCIVRTTKSEKSAKYYELQIKGAKQKSVSIRNAKNVFQFAKNNPNHYFLLIALRDESKYDKIIYLTSEDVRAREPKKPYRDGTLSINIPKDDVQRLLETQQLDRLIEKMTKS